MSCTELHKGKLIEVDISERLNDLLNIYNEEQINYGDGFSLENDTNLFFDKDDNIEYIHLVGKNKLYKMTEHTEFNDSEYLHETNKVNNEIHFTYLFYNGGTCFSEMLEEGLNKL